MSSKILRFIQAVATLVAISASAVEAGVAGKNNPPVSISGWRYSLTPPKVHMNVCEADACTPGSKVSYILYPPSPGYNFERFKSERAKAAEMMKTRMPGVAFEYGEPVEVKEANFTIMKLQRRETYPNGHTQTVLTSLILSPRMTVELISSSPNVKVMEANYALFSAPLLVIATSERDKP